MSAGKSRRLRRLIDRTGRSVILPLDIVVPVGPADGNGNTAPLVEMAGETGVSAVILRWGEAKRFAGLLDPGVGLIVRLSGSTGLSAEQPPVTINSVAASLAIGADAVCVDLDLGGERESESAREFARCCEEAEALGVPVLAEVHVPRSSPAVNGDRRDALAWGARTAREYGADLVKVSYPGSPAAVRMVCDLAELPIVVAGGARRDPNEALETAAAALEGGAAGTAFGRNVIGHPAPFAMQRALTELVLGRVSLIDVRASLGSASGAAADAAARDGPHAQHA
jgi:2-amino-4,5-dihydroxy-6-oxo-7-(phosphonooxy)heptanoate synthase